GGPVGLAIASGIKVATAIPETFAKVATSFIERGNELAKYSGEISGAQAQAEVVKLLADMKEAQVTGQQMAELIAEEARFSSTMQEILGPIKEYILEVLAGIMKTIADIMEYVRKWLEKRGLLEAKAAVPSPFDALIKMHEGFMDRRGAA